MIHLVRDNDLYLDGGAMYGVVPRALWIKTNPADERGRIQIATRCILYRERVSNRLFLIEAGVGDGWSPKLADIYGIDTSQGGLAGLPHRLLSELGVAAADITDLVLTHLHFDHAGWAFTYEDCNYPQRLTFPNAKIHLQKKHFEWAQNPSLKDRESFRKKDIEFLLRMLETKDGSQKIVLYEGKSKISQTVSLNPVGGHTQDMQLVKIEDDNCTFCFLSDLIALFPQLRIPWVMAYDNNPLVTMEEKLRLLKEASEKKWILVSYHDPFTACALVKEIEEGKFELDAIENSAYAYAYTRVGEHTISFSP